VNADDVTTLADLRVYITDGLAKIQERFERPDDDWPMVFFWQDTEGVKGMDLPLELFEHETMKDVLAEVLRRVVAQHSAFRYGIVMNAWVVRPEGEEELAELMRLREQGVRNSQVPGAFEQLSVHVGDAEQEQVWSARIERDGTSTPTLTEWENQTETATFEGRFVNLNAYMQEGRR
jgi:hypothetical protein